MDSPRLGRFVLRPESTVKVTAKPRQGIWHVLSFYRNGGDVWKIECRRASTGQTRYFEVGDLTYVAPSSERAKAATHDRACDRVALAALVPAKPIGRKAPRRKAAR